MAAPSPVKHKPLGKGGTGSKKPVAALRRGRPEDRPVSAASGLPAPGTTGPTFAGILWDEVRSAFPGPLTASGAEPLGQIEYARELELKNSAFRKFWRAHGLPDKPLRIAPSPMPRFYRTTTKRKVMVRGGRVMLALEGAASARGPEPDSVSHSALEPEDHSRIYAFIGKKLNSSYGAIARSLNYVIVRGNYREFCVIFNLHRVGAREVRKLKLLGEHLSRLPQKVVSCFLFHDPGRSAYYLDMKESEGPWKLKKLFGPDRLLLEVDGCRLLYAPTAFSQINASILPLFMEKARAMLKPRPQQRLLDLYCGYGLISLCLRRDYAEIWGADVSPAAVASARENAVRAGAAGMRFLRAPISAAFVASALPEPGDRDEAVVLDPPRGGVEPAAIKALARRVPRRVLHVFSKPSGRPAAARDCRKRAAPGAVRAGPAL